MTDRPGVSLPLVILPLLIGLAAVGLYFGSEVYLLDGGVGFPLDDSWIHLSFARNLADGHGLSINQGELVTGSTAPLWTALLSVLFLLPGSVALWTKALGVGLFLLSLIATYRLARELALDQRLAWVAAALVGVTNWLVWSALSGMEIPLCALLSLEGMTQHIRESRRDTGLPLSAVLLSLAALARPEGFLLLALAFAGRLWGVWKAPVGESRKASARGLFIWLGLAAVLLLPTMIFYRSVGESFLPTTYSAKAAGVQRWLPSSSYLLVVLGIFFPGQPLMTLLALGGAAALWREGSSEGDGRALPAAWLIGLPLAYSLISLPGAGVLVGNFGRYYFPLIPVVVVLGMVAIDRLVGAWLRSAAPGWSLLAKTAVVAALLLPTLFDLGKGSQIYTRAVLNVEDSDVAMARWLEDRLDPSAVLAVNDIGALSYMLPNRVVDLAGIGNPEIRDYYDRARVAGQPWMTGMLRFLEDERPDYLVVFPAWFPPIEEASDRFQPLHRIAIRDNITMGGDELVLYSTPWTRYPLR